MIDVSGRQLLSRLWKEHLKNQESHVKVLVADEAMR